MRAKYMKVDAKCPDQDAIALGGKLLREGRLVAFPTETVYGLGGNALDAGASEKIYAAKGRPSDNPLIVHIARMEDLYPIAAEIPENALVLAKSYWPGPLTMIFPKTDLVPLQTTGGLESVAVRFPSDPVAQALIIAAGGYVAAPSANTSGRPSPTTAQHVMEDLGERIDLILDSGPVGIGLESTIVDFTQEIPAVLRPGFISLEMLTQILGEVKMDPGLLKDDPDVRPKAPGMKYRHYAPKASLTIVEGRETDVVRWINEQAEQAGAEGKKVGILAASESADAYDFGEVICVGSRSEEEEIARHLYDALRRFDSLGVDLIYSEAFDTPRMGTAIMNRLLKAAGHHCIRV